MSVIRWKSFAAVRSASLCATCVWGTVRKGYGGGEVELSAASSAPTAWFPFPCASALTTPTGGPGAPAEASATGRRFGFVTTLSLQDKDETPGQQKARSRFNEPAPASS